MRLIGIAGAAGSGKDTIAERLAVAHGYVRYGFADPIKQACKIAFGLTDADLNDRARKEAPNERLMGKSPRQIMQWFGTELGRNMIHSDIWIHRAQHEWDELVRDALVIMATGMVIPDVRFENEAEFIRRNGGQVWHVLRAHTQSVHEHISESGVDTHETDIVFLNDGTIADLRRSVDRAVGYYGEAA